ncbi:hypothetical protein B7494_g3036 [Chlorociboria aeruginascens]|nr:hypothetical protein B7494_g3036 [Chlorociboria aeruginascens]
MATGLQAAHSEGSPWLSQERIQALGGRADVPEAMRSRTGCQTCRQRKLKCDEVKPECGQCRKAARHCLPSDGLIFRHQQNASMNGGAEVETGERSGKLSAFYAYRNTFDEHSIWVDVPKTVTFLNITDPFNMETTPEPEYRSPSAPLNNNRLGPSQAHSYFPFDEAPGLDALSTAATTNYDYIPVPSQSPGEGNVSQQSSNLNFILNPARPEVSIGERTVRRICKFSVSDSASPTASPPIDPSLTSSTRYPLNDERRPVEEHEVAFLLRHFGETTGQWMDLFDLGSYFAHQVPVQAISNPLLKYSACANAAKQLGRVRGRKAVIGGIVDRQAAMELFPHPETVDWIYLGAKYYDRAISLLMGELSNSGNQEVLATPINQASPFSPPGSAQLSRGYSSPQGHMRRQSLRPAHTSTADETLAATAILCVYEFLDNANTAWAGHLSGTKSLFDLAEKEGMMPVQSPTGPGEISRRIRPSRARRATFWNFARQDVLAAFINESPTRLNTEDFDLWRAAGLLLDENGFVVASNGDDTQYPDPLAIMQEDMISNALIWLMSKIINYLASGDSIDSVFPQDRASPVGVIGINQMILLERWSELEKELDIWYQGLPDTFVPCARLPPICDGSVHPDSPRAVFSEIWYSIPMCASTMQSYHMARILLLINKPHESTARRSTVSDRLRSYRSIEMETRHHSHEICGIALARYEASVRIHQVQGLFVAGQCLTDTRERRIILDLLRGIETDLGWATDYRVQHLLREWGWNSEA